MEKVEMKKLVDSIIPEEGLNFFETILIEYKRTLNGYPITFMDYMHNQTEEGVSIRNPFKYMIRKFKKIADKNNGHFCKLSERNDLEIETETVCGEEIFGIFHNKDSLFLSYSASFRCEHQFNFFSSLIPDSEMINCFIFTNKNRRVEEFFYRIKSKKDIKSLWTKTNHMPQTHILSMIKNLADIIEEGETLKCIVPER